MTTVTQKKKKSFFKKAFSLFLILPFIAYTAPMHRYENTHTQTHTSLPSKKGGRQ